MARKSTAGISFRDARRDGVWPVCRHPRTPENTQDVGVAGKRCKTCRREIATRSKLRSLAKQTSGK